MSLVRTTMLAALLLASCAKKAPPLPQPVLPTPQLQPFLPTLKQLIAAMPEPAELERRELEEYAAIALGTVDADARLAARAERALLDHADAWFALEPALGHDNVGVRRRAAWLCGRSGQSVLQLPLLLRLKYEDDSEAVLWIADALQRLGNDTGLAWIDAAMASNATAETAGGLAITICRDRNIEIADEPTYVELRQTMQKLSAQWRKNGKGGRPEVQQPLRVQLDARLARQLATTEGTLLRPVDDARFVLTRSGQLALPLLERTLGASEAYLRTMVLQVLADLGPCAHTLGPAVLQLLGDPLTAAYAVRTLGEIGERAALPHLRAMLLDPDTELRTAAVQALGVLQDQSSQPALLLRLQDTNEALDVRVGAAFALLCLGEHAAASAFLDERGQKGDYHAQALARLRERLARIER